MSGAGYRVLITGCDSITRKKLELYREQYPDVQLFFCEDDNESFDLIILPAARLSDHISRPGYNRLTSPPVMAFGADIAMRAAIAAGCDDYLCEPWGPSELFERASRCFRDSMVEAGAFLLAIRNRREIIILDRGSASGSVSLSSSELELFLLFSRNRGRFFNRECISGLLVNACPDGSRAADMHVARLRKRINGLLISAGGSPGDNPVITRSGCGWGIA